MSVSPARRAAWRELITLFEREGYLNLSLDGALIRSALDGRDKALFTKLLFGTVERKITVDYLLARFSDIPLNRLDKKTLVLLEMGLYQILYLDRVPDRATVNECVSLAKDARLPGAGYVNAVLRRAAREKSAVPALLDLPGSKGLALRESYPRYLVSQWTRDYGKERAEAICRAMNAPAALTLRVNTLKTNRADYAALLEKEAIPHRLSPLCENGIVVEKSVSPERLPGWEKGLIFIQDAGAQLASERVGAKPGDMVLDLCAAPGGKSFSLAMAMGDRGTIVALDKHPHRAELIRQGAERLGIRCISAKAGDASLPMADYIGKADRVLCDVPCSGSGVIAKKPDIRLKPKEESESLPALQLAILTSGSAMLRPGGRLVYVTCTLNKNENERVTDAFLAQNPAFHRAGEPLTLFPEAGENDGFFVDVLERET